MHYREWFTSHGKKHKAIMQKLLARGMHKTDIINYFDFHNMVKNEPAFCPLYKDNKKCHDVNQLNCFLCACPLFRFNDQGMEHKDEYTLYSKCAIDAKQGKQFKYGNAIHQDCSQCTVPHGIEYVSKNYDADWFASMQDCDLQKNR